ncbi:HNH endonuclease [Longimycelium tulufanense]|uniref:HNH endonuclease n=1 Tax=Longimycelium tulufanense TaxID=907463 RepID=UPI001662D8ED|nr:HNH endonuclease [Longimycelium tulufanense]
MPRSPGRSGHRWRQATAAVHAESGVCWICGHPIDYTAPPRTRWSKSTDHVAPLSRGGPEVDLSNLRPAHYGCNSRRGNRPDVTRSRTSRRW